MGGREYEKRNIKMLAVLTVVALLLCVPTALAGTSMGGGSSTGSGSELYNVNQFTFFHKSSGIGYGNCAVYTAPSSNAYRCANGRASCDTNHDMYVAGFDESGWLMVRYDTSDGGCRVGYIAPSDVRGYKFDKIRFQRIQQTANGTIKVTDNPLNKTADLRI